MTNVLPFPTNPVRRLSPGSRQHLSRRADDAVARPARAGVDRVADCVLALEASSLHEPCILASRNLARQMRVAVVMPGYDRLLTPSEARDIAQTLRAENAFAGSWSTALRLEQVADEADRRDAAGGPINPRPNHTGARFIIIAILIAAAVLALRAFG